MSKKQADLCVAIGSYKDRNGEEKVQWENIGVEMVGEDEKSFLLLKPWINLAGIPHEANKHIVVHRFFPKQSQLSSAVPASDEII